MVQRGRDYVDGGRPPVKQLAERLGAKGPFRAEDLEFAAQRIGQDIQLARDKLGQETNAMRLAKPQNGLGHGI